MYIYIYVYVSFVRMFRGWALACAHERSQLTTLFTLFSDTPWTSSSTFGTCRQIYNTLLSSGTAQTHFQYL